MKCFGHNILGTTWHMKLIPGPQYPDHIQRYWLTLGFCIRYCHSYAFIVKLDIVNKGLHQTLHTLQLYSKGMQGTRMVTLFACFSELWFLFKWSYDLVSGPYASLMLEEIFIKPCVHTDYSLRVCRQQELKLSACFMTF